MNSTLRTQTKRNSSAFSNGTQNTNRQAAIRPGKWQSFFRSLRRQFDPITIGLLVGGVALGLGGLILGICMPYHHPIGVNISMFWWSIFLGMIGAYIGACVGQLFEISEDQTVNGGQKSVGGE
jgi:hypothetical protein